MMRKVVMALAAVAIATAGAASSAEARSGGGFGGGHFGGFGGGHFGGGHFGGFGGGHFGGYGHPAMAGPAFHSGPGHFGHGPFFRHRFGPRVVFFGDPFPYGYYDDSCYTRVWTRWGWRLRYVCY